MSRLLEGHDVLVYPAGRSQLVPLTEIEAKLPAVWESIVTAEKMRDPKK